MGRSFSASLLVTLCLGAVSFSVSAQTATQGEAGDAQRRTEFTSPMVLETVFAAADSTNWKEGGWFSTDEYHGLGKYSCDGVSMRRSYVKRRNSWDPGLQMAVRELKDGRVEVRVKATVHNPPDNHDKKVTILLEVLNGEDLVAQTQLGPIDCEEGNEAGKQATLVLAREALRSDPMTRLRLTMRTVND